MAKHQTESDMILNSLLTAILLLDKNLHITYANTAALQLLEQNPKKLYGSTLPELCDYCSLDLSLMSIALSSGQGFTDNEVNLVIHHKLFVLSVTAQQFNQDQILIEIMPLNNHKRISQEQLLHDQHLAAKELVRGLAHEIKNPLGGLRGAAQLLSLELPKNELQEYTKLIIEQADRLRNLVDRLLGPQQVLKLKMNNIHVPIEKTYSLLRLDAPQNITLVRDYDPSIPDLLHDAEPLEQVILNLANNAIQALGEQEGFIIFRTRTVSQTTINGVCYRLCARIDIEDNGPGIPINLQDTIFYPLVSGRENGSGLGLSIAQHIIDQHHGKIEFVSWPGHTTFSIYLPIKQ